jgi:hypothetical protein
MRIQRRVFKQLVIAVMIAVIATIGLVSFALAEGTGVNIVTTPGQENASVYIDQNHNGLNDPEEFVGIFDVYNGDLGITFSWPAHAFAPGVNGSYRVALLQNLNPLGAAQWTEVAYAHHWADNPNGTSFTMGPFNAAYICRVCPTRFVVQPETYQTFYDPTTQSYEHDYTPVAGAYAAGIAALTQSEDFIIDMFVPGPPEPTRPKDRCEPEPINPEEDCECDLQSNELVCVNSCGVETREFDEACQLD